ncbi:MAG: hypothetical protein WC668_00295 [Patescibacteria group bacterium]|jgi:phosphomannomutase
MNINPKIFKEYDIRGKYPQELDEHTAFALGLAFAKVTKAKKIICGRDARLESEKVFWPLLAGLNKGGVKVYDLGVCATPELFFAVGEHDFPAGAMITASHSPAGETGVKFCDSRGRVFGLKTGLKKIKIQVGKIKQQTMGKPQADFFSVTKEYRDFVLSLINPQILKGMNVVVDASGGSGARLAETVFSFLPIKTTRMNFFSGDPYPDHGPNPLVKENQLPIVKEIKTAKADLGIVFDGDADRAIFIDEKGKFVEPYYLNCLLTELILADKPKIRIVIDARLGLGLAELIRARGSEALAHRAGYANIIKTMNQKKILFGCENSGHFMFNYRLFGRKKNYVWGDAILPILLILSYLKSNKLTLSQAIAKYSSAYAISGEKNYKVKDFDRLAKKFRQEFKGAEFSVLDGLSIKDRGERWYLNIRPSHTEPLARLNVEARSREVLAELLLKTEKLIK